MSVHVDGAEGKAGLLHPTSDRSVIDPAVDRHGCDGYTLTGVFVGGNAKSKHDTHEGEIVDNSDDANFRA
jgi:hypothetical protein